MIKILAIDDKPNNLVALAAIFSGAFPDAQVITALSGSEGIILAHAENPDVILLDLIMPVMDGIETCSIIKKDKVLKRIPVIMITASSTDSSTRIKALETGVEAFLSKPLEEAALIAQVSSLIRLKKSEDQVRQENKHLAELVLKRTLELKDSNQAAKYFLEELKTVIQHCRSLEKDLVLALKKTETSDKLKTAFMHNISHEVRTPLNGILGFSSLILQPDVRDEEKTTYYSLIKRSSERLLNTITNYMDISLITTGAMDVKMKPFDLPRSFQQLFDQFQPLCAEKKLKLTVKTPSIAGAKLFLSDQELLEKIFWQLLDNAVKFTEKGEICFGYEVKKGFLEFFIRDSGIGIGSKFLSLIFESFTQEETLNERGYEGSGLGLSIVQGLVQLLGGNIQVESEKGSGSSFIFSIPDEWSENDFNMTEATSIRGNLQENPVVLIVEDDENNLFFMESILNSYKINTITAENGKEAVDKCHEHPEITLVLMDLRMPVMDGLEATRKIKLFRKDLPVIAVTAFAMREDEKKALEAGCDGYLSKPINKESLLGKLSRFGVKISR